MLLKVPGSILERTVHILEFQTQSSIFNLLLRSFLFFFLAGDPELDAQVPAADLPGAAARGGGRPARHQHTAGALQELRIPGDTVHRRHGLSESTGTSWAFTVVTADLNVRTTEYTELQQPLSGVHSIMRVKLAQAGEAEGCPPTPFHYIYHHQ